MACFEDPVFVPDLNLPLDGDFDSHVTDPPIATIDTVGGQLHTTSIENNLGHVAYVQKDVFPAGTDEMYMKMRFQETTGNAVGSNLYDIVRIFDASMVRQATLALFQESGVRKITLWNNNPGHGWETPTGTTITTSVFDFHFCINRNGGNHFGASLVIDGVPFPATDYDPFGSGPIRYIQIGAWDDAAVGDPSNPHESFMDTIEIGTGACGCWESLTTFTAGLYVSPADAGGGGGAGTLAGDEYGIASVHDRPMPLGVE